MKKTLYVFLTVALLLGAVSAGALAKGSRPDYNGPRGDRYCLMEKSLNLSADQQQQFLAIRQDFQKQAQNLRFEMQKKRIELRQLWSAQPLDQAAIDAKTKEVTALKIQMIAKMQGFRDQLKGILTPEQLQKFNSVKVNFRPGMRGQFRQGDGFHNNYRGGCCK